MKGRDCEAQPSEKLDEKSSRSFNGHVLDSGPNFVDKIQFETRVIWDRG